MVSVVGGEELGEVWGSLIEEKREREMRERERERER